MRVNRGRKSRLAASRSMFAGCLAKPVPNRIRCIGLVMALAGQALAGEYHLTIAEKRVDLIGQPQTAILVDDGLPGPTLHWREGEQVVLHVENRLSEPTSIHWHGLELPYRMDGVPGISFEGIAPGSRFTYQFPVKQSGTYWYHGHSGMQEQQGLFGALIIDPAQPQPPTDRDYVVILSDWPQADPYRTLARLKKQSDYYNFQKRTLADFFADIERLGFGETVDDRLAWGAMRMDPTDLADVNGSTYRYLINGRTPQMQPHFLFHPGERVRLRFINASAMTYFDVRIPGLAMQVAAADGQNLQPLNVNAFRIAVAETYDVVVQPNAEQAYSIFAEAMDRSGYAHASLSPRADWLAPVPPSTPRTLLTLADMGGAHAGHAVQGDNQLEHAEHVEHAEHAPQATDSPEADRATEHSAHVGHHHAAMSPEIPSYQTLDYRNLRAQIATPLRKPDREIELRLTGDMRRYIWSFNDVKYADAEPIRVKLGEVVRFRYVNQTMMNHPIHIHGLWQYLDIGAGAYNPKKHVINVRPGTTAVVDVPAEAVGEWAFHCHLLYHMDTGMFRKLIVEPNHD
ncbi:copper resistance system multicopper oxidase [Methylomonas sp. EFPC3]|uniref:copper resistance system multicopper oxidase n=1 Tax=Methylomonas sp. EFPC3 TaxID=3021710 RepID=UPI0024179E04|nr:copper resistance system multicopper oxidase [Methylomonas sp. EFPC3]WFP51332.1 copper resistance system multicopper oxidase [Methylomonas sp. EFPC3]